MPITCALPELPSDEAFDGLREQIEAAKQEATDRAFLTFCDDQRREWRGLSALLSADPGLPAKKLTAVQRQQKRGLEAAGVAVEDIAELLAWFDAAAEAIIRLRHARAA
jgi:hypothetical protein